MRKNDLLILFVFSIVWLCKPISYQDLVRNQLIREKTVVTNLNFKGGDQDSIGKSTTDGTGFVPPKDLQRLINGPRKDLQRLNGPRPGPPPKVDQSQTREQNSPKLKVRYATPNGDDPGELGSNNGNDLQNIPDSENTISDPEFWNCILGEETEDESTPAEQIATSPPTKKLTQQSLKENDSVIENIQPREFYDWEGKKRVVKSKELKNATFSHGFEAKTSGPEDLVECPIQPDSNKFQRENCSRVTDQTVQKFYDKIVDITTSTKIGRVKFKTKMPYFDSEIAIGHMDIITGDCFFYHENGKFWTYKKYSRSEIPDLLMDVGSSLKWASDISSPRSDL